MSSEALDGLTVPDCSHASMAGCFASSYLAEFGAEVIRIEPPDFKCRDGYAFLAGFADINWKAFCTIIERPDLQERYPTIFDRLNLDNMKVMYGEIEKWTLQRTYDEIYQAVMEYNKNVGIGVVVPGKLCSPKGTMATQNWWERGMLLNNTDPHYDDMVIANMPHKMTASPPRVKWVCRPVGADNAYIYNKKLAWGPTKLAEMKEQGII